MKKVTFLGIFLLCLVSLSAWSNDSEISIEDYRSTTWERLDREQQLAQRLTIHDDLTWELEDLERNVTLYGTKVKKGFARGRKVLMLSLKTDGLFEDRMAFISKKGLTLVDYHGEFINVSKKKNKGYNCIHSKSVDNVIPAIKFKKNGEIMMSIFDEQNILVARSRYKHNGKMGNTIKLGLITFINKEMVKVQFYCQR